jgi:hypothetical protein
MKTYTSLVILLLLPMVSCNFSKSVNLDLITGLSTRGDGLSCDDVYISDGEDKLSRNSFTYGETFYLNFENIQGFSKTENSAFPGMSLLVTGPKGNTIFQMDDMYAGDTDGTDLSPLLLQAHLTVADPIHSDTEYTLQVDIWDKKGEGMFKAMLDFTVIPNEQIEIESKGVSYDEIYLFSGHRKTTITDNRVKLNETVYMMFEGLGGFAPVDGMVYAGLSIRASDAGGELLVDEEDLLGDQSLQLQQFSAQLAPNIVFNDSEIENPVLCEIVIWDKNSENRIKALTNLNLEMD